MNDAAGRAAGRSMAGGREGAPQRRAADARHGRRRGADGGRPTAPRRTSAAPATSATSASTLTARRDVTNCPGSLETRDRQRHGRGAHRRALQRRPTTSSPPTSPATPICDACAGCARSTPSPPPSRRIINVADPEVVHHRRRHCPRRARAVRPARTTTSTASSGARTGHRGKVVPAASANTPGHWVRRGLSRAAGSCTADRISSDDDPCVATTSRNAAASSPRSKSQLPAIAQAADRFAATILAGRMVHVFGSGHSRIMVEEMWPRYGSFPGFNPIVELSLTFHNLVVGANGQRQAMFLENVSGLAERILRNFDLVAAGLRADHLLQRLQPRADRDGRAVPAPGRARSSRSSAAAIRDATPSRAPAGQEAPGLLRPHPRHRRPAGDAMVKIEGLDTPVSPAPPSAARC